MRTPPIDGQGELFGQLPTQQAPRRPKRTRIIIHAPDIHQEIVRDELAAGDPDTQLCDNADPVLSGASNPAASTVEVSMTAQLIAFPLSRRRQFIRKQAESMAARSPGLAERYLAQQIKTQSAALVRKGFAPETVNRECSALERAIRSELARMQGEAEGGVA